MKRRFSLILGMILLFIALIFLLNVRVTMRQGIDYKVQTVKIPLYLKILGFLDRHYNYGQLVKNILQNTIGEKERIIKLFSWTYYNIREVPEGFPVIDDHVWHIIIRGYGVSDQSADVFTTLCNYSGFEAFFMLLANKHTNDKYPFSFVKLGKRWYVFDPYNGAYFLNQEDDLSDIEQIKKGDWKLQYIAGKARQDFDYQSYFDSIPAEIRASIFKRAQIQSPLKRIIFEIQKRIGRR